MGAFAAFVSLDILPGLDYASVPSISILNPGILLSGKPPATQGQQLVIQKNDG